MCKAPFIVYIPRAGVTAVFKSKKTKRNKDQENSANCDKKQLSAKRTLKGRCVSWSPWMKNSSRHLSAQACVTDHSRAGFDLGNSAAVRFSIWKMLERVRRYISGIDIWIVIVIGYSISHISHLQVTAQLNDFTSKRIPPVPKHHWHKRTFTIGPNESLSQRFVNNSEQRKHRKP